MKETNHYALRLQSSLFKEVKRVAEKEGTSVNQFINIAVAEKVAALRTEEYFRERAQRADIGAFWEILERSGTEPPQEGDELPSELLAPPA